MKKPEKFNPYMTCEGDRDKQYFEHLVHLINGVDTKKRVIEMTPSVTKNPAKFAKTKTMVRGKKWYHIIDRETTSDMDTKGFYNSLDSLAKIKFKAKPILGYSNISFELWLLLHKVETCKMFTSAKDYWPLIQRAYGLEDITGFDKYKSKQNFQKVLDQIDLSDVVIAINNADKLDKWNLNTCSLKKRNGFEFYEENPSLSVHKVVIDIFKEVGIYNYGV